MTGRESLPILLYSRGLRPGLARHCLGVRPPGNPSLGCQCWQRGNARHDLCLSKLLDTVLQTLLVSAELVEEKESFKFQQFVSVLHVSSENLPTSFG